MDTEVAKSLGLRTVGSGTVNGAGFGDVPVEYVDSGCRHQRQRPTSLAATRTSSPGARHRRPPRAATRWPRSELFLRPGR
jgi:hypothetical protein